MGEALNPGPFAIAAVNPTGLPGKSAEFDSFPTGIYAVSESHLTPQGLTRFRQELKGGKSKFHFFQESQHHIAASRSDRVEASKQELVS